MVEPVSEPREDRCRAATNRECGTMSAEVFELILASAVVALLLWIYWRNG
jgi:hypothetical protein